MSASPPHPERQCASRSARRRALLLGSLLPAGWILQLAASLTPGWTEVWFSRGLGPLLQTLIGAPVGLLPFSVAERLLVSLTGYLALRVIRCAIHCRKGELAWSVALRDAGWFALSVAGPLYLFFVLAWGLNYARPSFAVNAELDTGPPRAGELEELVLRLAERASALRSGLEEDERGVFRFSEGRGSVLASLPAAYDRLEELYPFLSGPPPISRQPWISPLMTLVGISGIFSPFTGESHVNATLPDLSFGFAACHEAAHRRGIAREDEANFVAYLACMEAGSPELEYSGTVAALNHALRDLHRENPMRARELQSTLSEAVRRDQADLQRFWTPAGPTLKVIRTAGEATNDAYLKSQRQAAGTASYGHVVRLLLAQARKDERP